MLTVEPQLCLHWPEATSMIVSKTRTCEMRWGTMDANEDELDISGMAVETESFAAFLHLACEEVGLP